MPKLKTAQQIRKGNLNKKAKTAGSSLVLRGGHLPDDTILESKYGYDSEAIALFKKSYYKYYTTDANQEIRKVQHSAKECAWKGRNLPSDKKLKKRYNENEILMYKETFWKYFKTPKLQKIRKEKHSITQKKYLKKKSAQVDSHRELFIKNFLTQVQKEIEFSAILSTPFEFPSYIEVVNTPLAASVESKEYIPSPYDVLKNTESNGLFFNYQPETNHPTSQLTQSQEESNDMDWISRIFTMD